MNITVIGSNGFLSNAVTNWCKLVGARTAIYGLEAPTASGYGIFKVINFLNEEFDYAELSQSDIIINCVGAGIQSNLNESVDVIYNLNLFLPIKISKALSKMEYKGTLVTFGSYFEIGESRDDGKFSEENLACSTLLVPNEYCISKRLLTRFVQSNIPTFKHIHLILPTIYGPNEASHRLIPYLIDSLNQSTIPKLTSGHQIRQYIYINDVVDILFKLINKKENGIFNIAGNETLTVRELTQIIYTLKQQKIPNNLFGTVDRIDVSMLNLQLDDSKLRNVIESFNYRSISSVVELY